MTFALSRLLLFLSCAVAQTEGVHLRHEEKLPVSSRKNNACKPNDFNKVTQILYASTDVVADIFERIPKIANEVLEAELEEWREVIPIGIEMELHDSIQIALNDERKCYAKVFASFKRRR